MGKVSLEGMEFYARHGYYEEERIIGNKYSVDVTIELDFSDAADSDKLDGTVNYERVYEIVAGVMAVDALLLEHLAGKIISELKASIPENQIQPCKSFQVQPTYKRSLPPRSSRTQRLARKITFFQYHNQFQFMILRVYLIIICLQITSLQQAFSQFENLQKVSIVDSEVS